jgi:hypothetical protein
MKYYVSVGAGGVFFRVGMAMTGMMGSLVYWQASRRRAAAASPIELASPGAHPGPVLGRPVNYGAIAAGSSQALSASRGAAIAAIGR